MKKALIGVLALWVVGCASLGLGKEKPRATAGEVLRFSIISQFDHCAAIVHLSEGGRESEVFSSQEFKIMTIHEEESKRAICFCALSGCEPLPDKSYWIEEKLFEEIRPYFQCEHLCVLAEDAYDLLTKKE